MSDQIKQLITDLSREIINPVIGLFLAVALAYFIYGAIQFIAKADNEEARKKGKRHLIYSVLGLVLMVSVWGILQLIINTLGVPSPDGFQQLN